MLSLPRVSFTDELRSHIGKEGPEEIARDPVNPAMIRHWCDAMEDAHPCYTDPQAAARSSHGELVAPPAMLNAWTMPGLVPRPSAASPTGALLRSLDTAGFTSVVATDSEHEYLRYLRLGDLLHATQAAESVSEEKQTALGRGHFVTWVSRYRTQDGEEVGRMRFRVLKFEPGTGRAPKGGGGPERPPPPGAVPRPPRRETDLVPADVTPGTALPPCSVDVTTTLIVAGAIASRDYQDVHHDRDLARERGSPDIFMNILTTSGLVGRYVTDWAGPEARLTSLRIRLGAPNYPGDRMVFTGEVIEAEGADVAVAVTGTNALGPHVTGRVGLTLAGP